MNYAGGEDWFLYVPLFLWIGVIIFFSSGKNSVSRTLPFFVRFIEPLLPEASSAKVGRSYIIIRKLSHFFGYAILALLASVTFINSSIVWVANYWYACAFSVTLVVAAADEGRQHFDPDRVGSLSDVALDCMGGVAGIFLFWIISKQ